jgi:hypothetical protein
VSGLIDAEGCFSVTIYKKENYRFGWCVRAQFSIELDSREIVLIKKLKVFFGGIGRINKSKTNNSFIYCVTKLSDLTNVIITHFVNYPLLTQKAEDFKFFKQVVELMQNKEHLTLDGLQKIVNIKASMNLGLSDQQKKEFSKIKPVERQIIKTTNIPNPN